MINMKKQAVSDQPTMLGMIHIPGVNDEAFAEFIKKQSPVVKSNLNLQLP